MRRSSPLLLLALLLLALAPAARAQEPIDQLRAFWVDALNPGFYNHPQVDELVETTVRAGANTIIVQVRRHGDAWYNNSFEPRAADPRLAPASAFDPLAYLIEKAHSRGVQVHAWLVISVTCRNSDALRGHPQHVCTSHGPGVGDPERWTTATHRGEQVGDLDFGHPAAVSYLERVVQHLLGAYPQLDGLHWDYIRYGGQSYGYNQVSVERFNRAVGRPPESRPEPTDPAWSQWRRDRVTETVRRLYIRAKAIKPTIQISAATITWGGAGSGGDWQNSAAYRQLFQDWPAWLEEGILDFAVPMHYFAEGNAQQRGWYDSWMAFDRNHVGRRAIASGIGAWLNSADGNIAQAQRALAPDGQGRALAGVSFFSYAQPVSGASPAVRAAFADQLRAGVFSQPARVPAWPWVFTPSAGMLQGIAVVDGQVAPEAKIALVHNGQWLRDIYAAADGWYGAIELPPGQYTVVITRADGRQSFASIGVYPGLVASL